MTCPTIIKKEPGYAFTEERAAIDEQTGEQTWPWQRFASCVGLDFEETNIRKCENTRQRQMEKKQE